jgi:hypothetical protein
LAEPSNCCKDFIGGFRPSVWFWIGIVMLDEGMDVSFEFGCRAVNAALQLLAC